MRTILLAALVLAGAPVSLRADEAPSSSAETTAQTGQPEKRLFTGRVVLLADALKKRGVKAYDEEIKGQVVLETEKGALVPLIPDWRGRAFFQDKRLRDRKVELVGYRREGVPYLQVLMVFTFDEQGRRMYTDYWCDICSIPMYEIKPCDCCQGPIRLRFQPRELPDYLDSSRRTEDSSTDKADRAAKKARKSRE